MILSVYSSSSASSRSTQNIRSCRRMVEAPSISSSSAMLTSSADVFCLSSLRCILQFPYDVLAGQCPDEVGDMGLEKADPAAQDARPIANRQIGRAHV